MLVGSALALGTVNASAKPWVSSAPQELSAKPKSGKNVKEVASPDGKYTLILRDEGEQGDFVWYSLYLKQGGKYTLIGTFNEVDKIVWKADSSVVNFHAIKAVESNVQQDANFQYDPAAQKLKTQVIKLIPLAD